MTKMSILVFPVKIVSWVLTWSVASSRQIPSIVNFLIQLDHLTLGVMRVDHILDILQTLVLYFVSLRQDINLFCADIDEDVVSDFKRVEIRMRLGASALEVFAADKTSVHVYVR